MNGMTDYKVADSSSKDDELITSQYRYIKHLSESKYSAEESREANLITQSSQMQTAFSFVTAAIFMATPIIVDNRGRLSLNFLLIAIAVPVFFLIASLLFASIAQWRWRTITFPDISVIKESVIGNSEWEKMCIEYNQIDQYVNLIAQLQKEKTRLNDRRVKLIMVSMISFYLAIGTVILFFVIALFNLFIS